MAESVPQLGQQPHHHSTNWTQCIVCQKPASNKTLVLHPRIDFYQHLLNLVLERTQLQDSKFVPIQKRLKDYTAEILQREGALTKVGALPLLPEVAHQWPTLLTVIVQACKLKELVIGNDHPTVISLDMALYEKALQLVDSRPDLKSTVFLRLGELHVVMAAVRPLGASIENSGIDDAWIEADVYGPATTRQ